MGLSTVLQLKGLGIGKGSKGTVQLVVLYRGLEVWIGRLVIVRYCFSLCYSVVFQLLGEASLTGTL